MHANKKDKRGETNKGPNRIIKSTQKSSHPSYALVPIIMEEN